MNNIKKMSNILNPFYFCQNLAELGVLFGNQARNFFQISSRALAASLSIGSKNNKKTSFKEPFSILVNTLGGDFTNLTCSGKSVRNDSTVGMRKRK